jgi:hypothetical protein
VIFRLVLAGGSQSAAGMLAVAVGSVVRGVGVLVAAARRIGDLRRILELAVVLLGLRLRDVEAHDQQGILAGLRTTDCWCRRADCRPRNSSRERAGREDRRRAGRHVS